MAKVIVGIHGLANKPDKEILAGWWQDSVRDGLLHIESPVTAFSYVPVHWADLMYKNPLHDDERFTFDALYNSEPYRKPEELKRYRDRWIDAALAATGSTVGGMIDGLRGYVGLDALADALLAKKLKDLAFYYDKDRLIGDRAGQQRRARHVLMAELKNTLLPLKGNQLMLIGHSMGSIIAYDVLRDIGQTDDAFEVAHFVTIGSPLGLPTVKANVYKERKEYAKVPVRTPSVVIGSWVNFADRRDPVAADTHLADDYQPNDRGMQVRDDIVLNDYESSSHHKSYGYLRTPELSEHIRDFLAG